MHDGRLRIDTGVQVYMQEDKYVYCINHVAYRVLHIDTYTYIIYSMWPAGFYTYIHVHILLIYCGLLGSTHIYMYIDYI